MTAVLCIPYFGGQHYQHLAAVKELHAALPGLTQFVTQGCPYICLARAVLAQMALDEADKDNSVDRILWIDHDIVFEAEDAIRMLEALDDEHPIIGAPYSMKKPGRGLIGPFDPSSEVVHFYKKGGLYPALPRAGVGMGFTAVLLKVYRDLAPTLPLCPDAITGRTLRPFYALEATEEGYFGEDFSFCRRAQKIGHKSFLDTRPRLLHMGSYAYKIEDAGTIVPALDGLTIVNKTDGLPHVPRALPINVIRDADNNHPIGVDPNGVQAPAAE